MVKLKPEELADLFIEREKLRKMEIQLSKEKESLTQKINVMIEELKTLKVRRGTALVQELRSLSDRARTLAQSLQRLRMSASMIGKDKG